MSTQPKMLHYFTCRVCSTVMTLPVLVRKYERCNGCRSWMAHKFSVPVETAEQEAIWKRGRVFNPHKGTTPARCDMCGRHIFSEPVGHDTFIEGVGQFCRDKPVLKRFCTTEGLKRHEAAMTRKEETCRS